MSRWSRVLRLVVFVLLFTYLYRCFSTDTGISRLLRPLRSGTDPAEEEVEDDAKLDIKETFDTKENTVAPAPEEMRSMRIGVATINTSQNSYMQLSLSDKQAYTRKHGYGFHVDFELGPDKRRATRGAIWHKLSLLEKMIKTGKYDWVWWIDFDTLITNHNVKLEDIIVETLRDNPHPDKIDMILTADCFGINAGSMLFRANSRVLAFFDRMWECAFQADGETEQDCMQKLGIKDIDSATENAAFIAQWKMNAFPENVNCRDKFNRAWEKGMFVIHFAGAWAHVKGKDPYGRSMRRYQHAIIRDPPVDGSE